MKKNIIIILIILIIILLVGDIIRRLNKDSTPAPDTTPTTVETPQPVPSFEAFNGNAPVLSTNSERVNVKGRDGTDISVLDFRQAKKTTNLGDGFYHIDGGNVDTDLPYSILYNETDYSYSISLEASPLSSTRQRVSNDLLTMLGISATEACKLNVYVGVTYDIDQYLSGQNLGLSYCPDSVPL